MFRRNAADPVVLSLYKLAESAKPQPPRSSFHVLVEHLLTRLLSSASLDTDDDASISFFTQAVYAVALPTMLFALYLFPAYHQPRGKPPFMAQATHHLFYVDVSFAVMGLASVMVWDLMFPDPSDVLIMGSLPLSMRRLLAARTVALAFFLGGILLGTSMLGVVFFPAVADLPMRFPLHFLEHAVAVWTAGMCGALSGVLLQGATICLLPQRAEQALSPLLQAACVLLFTLVLVLEPLFAHLLQPASALGFRGCQWFPPFLFLGIYEALLSSGHAHVFIHCAALSLLTLGLLVLGVLGTYPLAFLRRMQQAIENTQPSRRPFASTRWINSLGSSLLRDGRTRGVFHWISQTLPRTRRTRLVAAFFGALLLGAPSAVFALSRTGLAAGENTLLLQLARLSVPATAFLTIAGLRTAFRAPVARGGAWAFRVISGGPGRAHKQGTELWAVGAGSLLSACAALLNWLVLPPSLRMEWNAGGQAVLGIVLSLLLTRVLFLADHLIPFTRVRERSVNDLSFTVVTYFVLFPVSALALAAAEPWLFNSRLHIAEALLLAGVAYALFRRLDTTPGTSMEEEPLLPGEMGLRT